MSTRGKLKIERIERTDAQAVIHRLEGVLTDLQECYTLLENVRGELKQGFKAVVLNLARVDRVTSAGVGIIAACFTSAKNAGGRLCLVQCSPRVRELMEIVGLWSMLETFDDEEQACRAVGR